VIAASAACASGGTPESVSSGAPVGSAPAASVATGTAAQATPTPLEDGRNFGFISAADAADRTIEFDVASFIEGKRANKIAAEDGEIESGEKLDSDYYIRNRVEFQRTLELTADAKIRVVGEPPDVVDGDFEDFAAAFQSDEIQPFGNGPSYRGRNGKYWVTLEKGEVTLIEEQYVP
jgi:hypothetical protein